MFKMTIPPDSTFLSEVMYEGILQYLKNGGNMKKALENVCREERILKGSLPLVGNDLSVKKKSRYEIRFPEKLLQLMNPSVYNDGLIRQKIEKKENIKNLFQGEFIKGITESQYVDQMKLDFENILVELKKDSMVIGGDELAAPQILKVDRYTGITSLEEEYTDKQMTLRLSKDMALLFLLGMCSSYVAYDKPYIYFLFFSPDEVVYMLLGSGEQVERIISSYFMIKNNVVNKLREIIRGLVTNEILLLEVALGVELQELMLKENIDRISMILFRIAIEGNTYKVYELVPIHIYRKPAFYEILKTYVRDPLRFCRKLSDELSPSKPILKTLASFKSKNKFPEADNILRAIQGLYRFIILGDSEGLLQFHREISNAYTKLVNSSSGNERARAVYYLRLLHTLMW